MSEEAKVGGSLKPFYFSSKHSTECKVGGDLQQNTRRTSSWWKALKALLCGLSVRTVLTSLYYVFMHYSLFGWDHVTQGLVQLGFTLMDAFGPKMFGMGFIC